jgi:hypothetical protein
MYTWDGIVFLSDIDMEKDREHMKSFIAKSEKQTKAIEDYKNGEISRQTFDRIMEGGK